jgi:predicted MFS family arabinose efflux permease
VGIGYAVLFLLAQTLPAFLLALALQGIFRALDSGPLEAWYVDTAQADDPDVPVERALSLATTVLGLAIAVGALASGGLVAWHPISQTSSLLLPFWIALGINLVHLVLTACWSARSRDRRSAPARAVSGPPFAGHPPWSGAASSCSAPRRCCGAWFWSRSSGVWP